MAADATSNGNQGAVHGATWIDSTSAFQGALRFDGSDYVSVPHSIALDAKDNEISVEARIKVAFVPLGPARRIVSKGQYVGGGLGYMFWYHHDGRLALEIYSTGGVKHIIVGGDPLQQGVWHYVAGTYDGAWFRLYVDGAQVAEKYEPFTVLNSRLPLVIGAEASPAIHFFEGDIDEVRISNRALDAEEVSDHHRSGLPYCGAALRLNRSLIAGCLTATGRLTVETPAPVGGLTVTLHSDSPNVIVPASVLLKAGAVTRSFSIQTSAVTTTETATIEASVPGDVLSATLTLKPMGVRTLLLSPDPVVGGATVSGIVALQCAAGPGDITVNLSSTKPDIAAPTTTTVTIPVGMNFLPFEVTTTPVTAEAKATISATANGVKKSKALAVTPGP